MSDSKRIDNQLDEILHAKFGKNSGAYWFHYDQAKIAIKALIQSERIKGELYGRLHSLIEDFQAGRISAEYYSDKYEELTNRIVSLREAEGTPPVT